MNKKTLLCLLCIILCAVFCISCADTSPDGTDTSAVSDTAADTSGGGEDPTAQNPNPDHVINSFYDLNKINNEQLSHKEAESYASLELDFRSLQTLEFRLLKTMTVYYPRLKKMQDGNYILFYQEGEHGDTVYYTVSSDLVDWETPSELFIHEEEKDIKYATCDAVVLDNGDILAVCSYREGSTYDVNPHLNGIVMKKSSDNGKTWTEQKKIYVGTTWEPYPMQLSSGEVQVYFTNTTCYYRSETADASTGTAMVRSLDRGETWTGDLSKPYSAQIVSQTPTRVSGGVQLYSDQMPVGIEMLGSGKIMLALETRLDKNGSYRISLSYSSDNWAKPLAANETGPSEKISKAWTGAAPYLRQFVSGEIVCAYARQSNLTYKMFDSTGKNYTETEFSPFEGIANSYWGSLEMIDTHTVVGLGETFKKVTVTRTENTIDYGKLNLNHSINAEKMTPAIDGAADDWKNNDEALFVGSMSQAQVSVRSAHDDNNVYFIAERLDGYLETADDTVALYFEQAGASGYYRVVAGLSGVTQFDYFDGKKFNNLGKEKINCAVKVNGTADRGDDEDVGYTIELSVPKSEIGGVDASYVLSINLNNADAGKRSERDGITGTDLSDKKTWMTVYCK